MKQKKILRANNKGQVSLEYLTLYVWAFLIIMAMVGVMHYFNLFNTERYAAQHCTFDANFFCQDYVIAKSTTEPDKFDVHLKLQNNMNEEIQLNKVKLLNREGVPIECAKFEVYCRHNETIPYAHAQPSDDNIIIDDHDTEWDSTMICRTYFERCNKNLYSGAKEEINFELNFSRVGSSASHLSYGVVYAAVQ